MLSIKEVRQNDDHFGHDIHPARMICNPLGWEKAGCWLPSFKGKDHMSKIPKFGALVTQQEYARKREQEP
jgi:hypothetical protein